MLKLMVAAQILKVRLCFLKSRLDILDIFHFWTKKNGSVADFVTYAFHLIFF